MENKINKRENKIKPSVLSTTQIQRLNLKKIKKLIYIRNIDRIFNKCIVYHFTKYSKFIIIKA